MKRFALALVLLSLAVPAMAFRPGVQRGDRIGVLRPILIEGTDTNVAIAVSRSLQKELRARGLDAVDAGVTYEDLRREQRVDADLFVEIAGGGADENQYGGIGVRGAYGGVDIGMVVSRVAAQMRVYDGHTLELIDTFEIAKRSTMLLPTSAGVGAQNIAVWVALPFVQYARYRTMARAVATEAANAIASQRRE
jgi:hypothetical protein